ncbi:MAG TPA: FAD-binding oxidoreductase [Acidimicrobiales bacterium]|nr:FAD-binding oxidoreductase [Acidimicrobiales bacterium]
MTTSRRSWWGWGWEDAALTDEQTNKLAASVRARFGVPIEVAPSPPQPGDDDMPRPRVSIPDALKAFSSADPYERALHTYGRSFRDVVRGLEGDLSPAPSFVAHPRDEADVTAVLDWATSSGTPVVPFGGGSSVCGGVELPGAVSMDLTALDRVLEVDRTSRAIRVQAGALGPVLEDQLRPHGLTLRHFPQSFEFSTVGGWLATRSGGHYASVYTHIDDLVESMRVLTPTGVVESRRLPGSGAGPSPDRMFLGSEGILGVISEAWLRVQDRPRWKASAGVRFADYARGVEAVRALSQSALFPTNCRLLDATEAATSAGVEDGTALLVLGFESADHPVDTWIARAVELALDHGGAVPDGIASSGPSSADTTDTGAGRGGAVGAWRNAFVRAPYTRDALVRMGLIVETFETATTWDRFPALHADVTEAVQRALKEVCGGIGWVTCRFTHVYPDGPAPYFSVFAASKRGSQLAQWAEIKAAASEVLVAHGATITHHHAVGRDHRPWYDRQRPDGFATALRAAKASLDPAGVLNPGVLIDT